MADKVVVGGVVIVLILFCDTGAMAAEKGTTIAMIIWISIRFIFCFVIM